MTCMISDKIYQFPIYLSQGNLNPWDAAVATTFISFFIGFLGMTLDLFVILHTTCWNLEEGTTITTSKIKMFLQIMLSNLSWESYEAKPESCF